MEKVNEQTIFVPNSLEQNTQSLADYLPGGDYFRAKNINGSNFRRLLTAFAYEIGRTEAKIQELANEFYIPDTFNLIESWERFLGIPDKCFSIKNKTIEERRKQVIAKIALMNLTTTQDFIDLAAFFGVRVEIYSGTAVGGTFPYTFPMTFPSSGKIAKFTMIVKFLDIPEPPSFPITFPYTFPETPADFIICLFEQLKPAPVTIVVKYKDS